MSSFECEKCRTLIHDSTLGYITGCEHYPIEKLKPQERHKRTDFPSLLAKYVRAENVGTKSVYKQILKSRIENGDLS